MNSVRQAALIWMTALLTLVGLIGAGLAYELDFAQANALLDGQLRQIASNARTGPGPEILAAHGSNREDEVLVQIWDGRDTKVHSSDPNVQIALQNAAGFADAVAAGEAWRVFQSSQGDFTVQASQRYSVRRDLARIAAFEAAMPILVTIPLGWLVVGWGLNRVLGRLTALAGEIAARGVESKRPIPDSEVPVEVSPLVRAMNALIARLQQSLEQQRQFLSDAAHELRTPLAALRLQIDALQLGRDAGSLDSALSELGQGAERASTLVDQLLRLARYDAGADGPEPEPVDLVALVVTCVADHVAVADQKRIDLGLVCAEPACIDGRPGELRILFANLIQNAIRYTDAGGVVDIAIRNGGGLATVEIADTGCGIPDDALPRVFDRFFRAAPPDIEGTGLGLAICKAIAVRHGLTIDLKNRDDGPGLVSTVTAKIAEP